MFETASTRGGATAKKNLSTFHTGIVFWAEKKEIIVVVEMCSKGAFEEPKKVKAS